MAADHSLWELSGYGWQMLSPTGTIQGVSATSGTGGVAVAFALAADSSLWQYAGGWTMLSPAGTIRSISAGTQDDVFAVAADQSLWEFNGAAWEMLSPAGTILSIQTGTSATVGDVVFALAADHSLWADGAGGWGLVSPAGTVAAIDELLRTPVGAGREQHAVLWGVRDGLGRLVVVLRRPRGVGAALPLAHELRHAPDDPGRFAVRNSRQSLGAAFGDRKHRRAG